MEMNSANVEAVVKQVLESMLEKKVPEAAPAQKAAGNEIPKTAHVAMLTALEHFEIKEYPMPEVGDGDILVKVEGCGVCGTDAHEFKRDPFSLIPVVLGHEGTGEIVKMGKNVKVDSAGKALNLGDKVVTCVISGSSLKIIQVTTLSPILTGFPAVSVLTFLPMATISPVPSCPRTTGISPNGSFLYSCASVPQTPHPSTLTRMSSSPTSGSGYS